MAAGIVSGLRGLVVVLLPAGMLLVKLRHVPLMGSNFLLAIYALEPLRLFHFPEVKQAHRDPWNEDGCLEFSILWNFPAQTIKQI
jgi:hypothetical protein